MANTRDTMGEQACLDALVAKSLTSFEDDGVKVVRKLKNQNNLVDVILPSAAGIDANGMSSCVNLTTVDMLGGGRLESSCLSSCSKLTHLVLRDNTDGRITYLNSISDIGGNISIRLGAVYVPDNLMATYRSSIWKYFAVKPLSEYPATDFSSISDTWSEIIEACNNGTYSTKYIVGDTKSIVIGGTTYYMQLVAKNADVLASDGTTTVPTTWIMRRLIYGTRHPMNSTNTVEGGWASSGLRSWLADDVLPLLPSEVRTAIKEVKKYSGSSENGVFVKNHETVDKLWIPSLYEVGGGSELEDIGPRYLDIYSTGTNSNAKNTRIEYDTSLASPAPWWLRSFSAGSVENVTTSGSYGFATSPSSISTGVVFGFCI